MRCSGATSRNLLEENKGLPPPESRPTRITPAVMKRGHWVDPVLVVQIKFTEWTSDDQFRQPVFLGLRTDKQPKDVVHE
jgi:ATP-dependent DNA ligase